MPRAKSSAASSSATNGAAAGRTLAQTVHEKALDPSRVLSGGSFEDVIRVRAPVSTISKTLTSPSRVIAWWCSPA